MGSLIFCKERSVRHPYYVAELGLHLFSGEELSYYVYNNLLLIPEDFPDEKLYDFLVELGHESLAEKLPRIREQSGLYECLYVLIQELRYYTQGAELAVLRRQIDELAATPEVSRLKAKADKLFGLDQYYSAIRVYDSLLSGADGKAKPGPQLTGEIWYDKGCCYARMEDFNSALTCFLNAYELLRDTQIPEKIFALSLMDPELKLPKEFLAELTKDQKKQFRSNYEERRKLSVYQGKALEAAVLTDCPDNERGDRFLSLLHEWKTEYRRKQV